MSVHKNGAQKSDTQTIDKKSAKNRAKNQKQSSQSTNDNWSDDVRSSDLYDSPMMDHLLKALEAGTDIGVYGRLTFTIIARHFMEEDEIVDLLARQPGGDEEAARAQVLQVKARDYSPPKRSRILAWQEQQDFPICPHPEDPNSCNVYRELEFPQEVYDRIEEFWEEKVEAEE